MAVIIDSNKSLDWNRGNKIDVEVVDEKLQLTFVGEIILSETSIPEMTSDGTPSGQVIRNSFMHGYPGYYAFESSNNYWQTDTNPSYIGYKFTLPKIIKRYSITIDPSYPNYSPRDWEFQGSNDNSNWTTLDTQSNHSWDTSVNKKTFTLNNNDSFLYYRIYITNKNDIYVNIAYIEMFEKTSFYKNNGYFESNIIDFSQYVRQIGSVTNVSTIPTGTTINIYTSTSNDYVNFSEWSLIDDNGNITSPQGRYIKVKVELVGDNKIYNMIVNDFTEAEKTQFEENPYVDFDGSLKLKTTYEEQLEKDLSWTYDGALFRKSIDVSNFKTIEKFKVI